ncbi:MAG: hypothetical protein AAF288_04625 [Planctomycetota bacterium]
MKIKHVTGCARCVSRELCFAACLWKGRGVALLFAVWLGGVAHADGVNDEALRHEVIEIEVDAVAVGPEPFRWELLPPAHEIRSGNAAVAYREAFSDDGFMLLSQEPHWAEIRRLTSPGAMRSGEPADSLPEPTATSPLAADALDNNLGMRGFHEAARYRQVDWEIKLRPEPLNSLLPHLSEMRVGVSVASIEARRALDKGDFGEALDCIRTVLAVARHASPEAPVSLIESITGLAILRLSSETMTVWCSTPRAPNLYFALSELPSPVVSLVPALRTERDFFFFRFPELADHDVAPTDEQCIAMLDAFLRGGARDILGLERPVVDTTAFARAHLFAAAYPHARYWLREHRGWTEEQIDELSPVQAVAVVARSQHMENRDRVFRWATLPLPERLIFPMRDDAFWDEMIARPSGLIHLYDRILFPALGTAGRLEAKPMLAFARLRVIESLRHHVATHGGALPASLDELELPPPDDPCTGRPFGYRVEDGAVILEDELLEVLGNGPGANVRYVIRFRDSADDNG